MKKKFFAVYVARPTKGGETMQQISDFSIRQTIENLTRNDNSNDPVVGVIVAMYQFLGTDRSFQVFDIANHELPRELSPKQRQMVAFIVREAKKEIINAS